MSIQIKMQDGDQMGRKFQASVKRFSEKQILATQATAQRVKEELETQGRADMAAGGDFDSDRWQQGLQAKVSYQSRFNLVVRLTHAVKYWRVFEYGAKIKGKPLLWIPLSFAADALGKSARDFGRPLFRVDRAGKAPLLLADDGPKYFGKESVTIPKKWHLRSIARSVAGKVRSYYNEAMKNG